MFCFKSRGPTIGRCALFDTVKRAVEGGGTRFPSIAPPGSRLARLRGLREAVKGKRDTPARPTVMPGLDPGIHDFMLCRVWRTKVVDHRVEPGDDAKW